MTFKHENLLRGSGLNVRELRLVPSIKTFLRTTTFPKVAGKDVVITVDPTQQLSWYEELLATQPGGKPRVFVISAANQDNRARAVAATVMDTMFDSGMRIKWVDITAGYGNPNIKSYPDCDVLFVGNVVSSSTPHKLELMRDLLTLNAHAVRVVVTAGWNGVEAMRSVQFAVNGFIYMGAERK